MDGAFGNDLFVAFDARLFRDRCVSREPYEDEGEKQNGQQEGAADGTCRVRCPREHGPYYRIESGKSSIK
jgi:hypothetical protein